MSKLSILASVYEFESDAELKSAQILTESNIQFIKTQIGLATQERINIVPDPNNYPSFIQQDAALKGEIKAYQYLLDCHYNTIHHLNTEPPERGQE